MPSDDLFGSNLLQFLRRSNIFGVDRPKDDTQYQYRTPPFIPESSSVLPALNGTNSDKRYGSGENIFSKTSRTGSVVESGSDSDNDYDPASRMKDLYEPETRMTDRYMQTLDEMPIRNKPGLLRKIFAGAVALGGDPDKTDRALYEPYYRQMDDWKAKMGPLTQATNLERGQNSNLRMIANQILSQEMGNRRLDRQRDRDVVLEDQGRQRIGQGDARIAQGDDRIKQGDDRIKQSNERMKIAREVAKGGQFEVDDSGQAFIVKRDGSKIPVDGSYLSFEEKEELRAETAGTSARARESVKRDRIVERVIEDPDNPGNYIRARVNLDTGDVEPLSVKSRKEPERPGAAPPRTELEQGRGVSNKAQQIKAGNAKWSKWIKIDKGRVEITRPGIFSGPSEEEYDKIYQAIYGTIAPESATRTSNTKGTRARITAPGKVRVIGPNGEKGTVSVEDANNLPPGWRKE